MPQYVYDGAGSRTVEAKGDIRDVITMLALDEHPLLARLPHQDVEAPDPKSPEDSLSAVDTGNAYAEGETAPSASDTSRTLNSNWCQILMKTASVSNYQNTVAQYGIPNTELDYQEGKKVVEILNDAEAILVSDQAKQAPTAVNNRLPKMAGMSALISTYASSATFNLSNVIGKMKSVRDEGGHITTLWCDGSRKNTFNGFSGTATVYSKDAATIRKDIDRLQTSYGTLDAHYHPRMPQDIAGSNGAHALLLDESLWFIADRVPLNREPLAYQGGSRSVVFEMSLAPLCKAEKGNALFN